MAASTFEPLTGHCTCKAIQYTLTAPPLVVHCCHCTWCQRETGSAFALNAQIEAYNINFTSSTEPKIAAVPAPSGKSQLIAHCPNCLVAVYSHYASFKSLFFVKAGTLANSSRERIKPSVHIFTSTKLDWLDLTKEKERGVPIYDEYYKREDVWSKESLERRKVFLEWVGEQKKAEAGG